MLAHQFKIHLNISATCEKIVDEIASEAKKDLSDKDVHSQSEISELYAASNLFLADIVVFKDANQHTVIKAKKSVDGRPLYVLQHNDNTFESVTFKHESTSLFNVINGLARATKP